MKRPKKAHPSGLSRRLSFPEDERRYPWLPSLLDCYAIADTGVAVAVRDAEKKLKKKLACSQGCHVCCLQPDIPLYPHELPGLAWYISERLENVVREAVVRQLASHRKGSPCPFLVDRGCSVHPVRPVACRQYNVFTSPCAPGEDPYYERRDDVLAPPGDYTDRAFAAVASFYGMEKDRDTAKVVRQVKSMIMNLQEYAWEKLLKTAEAKNTPR